MEWISQLQSKWSRHDQKDKYTTVKEKDTNCITSLSIMDRITK